MAWRAACRKKPHPPSQKSGSGSGVGVEVEVEVGARGRGHSPGHRFRRTLRRSHSERGLRTRGATAVSANDSAASCKRRHVGNDACAGEACGRRPARDDGMCGRGPAPCDAGGVSVVTRGQTRDARACGGETQRPMCLRGACAVSWDARICERDRRVCLARRRARQRRAYTCERFPPACLSHR
jgi:hypothetical protein